MTTALDTCVLLDYLLGEDDWPSRATAALRQAFDLGSLILGEVVYAELMPRFASSAELNVVLDGLGIAFVPASPQSAAVAGLAWAHYRRSGGPRTRLIADFLVGAHAVVFADRLLTRDKQFYARRFPDLSIVEP